MYRTLISYLNLPTAACKQSIFKTKIHLNLGFKQIIDIYLIN
jgi:hypothetical protein